MNEVPASEEVRKYEIKKLIGDATKKATEIKKESEDIIDDTLAEGVILQDIDRIINS